MEKLISSISLFLITGSLYGFFYFQWSFESSFLFNDKPSVPLILATFGPLIQTTILALILSFLNRISASRRLFPRFVMTEFENEDLAYSWERISAALVLGFPILAFAWSWIAFLRNGAVYPRDRTLGLPEKGPFDYVSRC